MPAEWDRISALELEVAKVRAEAAKANEEAAKAKQEAAAGRADAAAVRTALDDFKRVVALQFKANADAHARVADRAEEGRELNEYWADLASGKKTDQ